MEHLRHYTRGAYMQNIKIQNCSNDYIEIIFLDKEFSKILEPNNSFDFTLNKNKISFIVQEYIVKKSFFYDIFEFLFAFLVSIPLWFINYFEVESIDKSIQFPIKFSISNLKDDIDYNIVINNSSEKYKAFNLNINNEFLSGKIEYSEKELLNQIKDYKKSLLISLLFPILVVICLLIVSVKLKNLILLLGTVFIIVLLLFFLVKTHKKNNLIIEKIKDDQGTFLE